MHWYNPKLRGVEDAPTPTTDEEAERMLCGHICSWAFLTEYRRRREDGMPIEQALIFVGHHFRMWHLRYQPVG